MRGPVTALTAAQIAAGAKNARQLDKPADEHLDQPGRWRCWLCATRRWRRGTLRTAHEHYTDVHQTPPEEHTG